MKWADGLVDLFLSFYTDSAVTLFLLLTRLASMSIQAITRDIQSFLPEFANEIGPRMNKWKRNYLSISLFIQETGRLFGLVISISLMATFFYLTFYGFEFYEKDWFDKEGRFSLVMLIRKAPKLLTMFKNFFYTTLMIYSTEQMETKASNDE